MIPFREHSHYVVGAGSIGCSLASLLSSVISPVLISRTTVTPDLHVRLQGDISRECNIPLLTLSLIPSPDRGRVFWVCTKAYDLDLLLEGLRELLTDSDVVVLCMNGIGMFLQAREILPARVPALRCLLSYGVAQSGASLSSVSSRCIQVSGQPRALIASTATDRPLRQSLRELLENASFAVSEADNIATAEWEKGIVNLVVNSLATLYDAPNDILLSDSAAHARAERLFLEAKMVAETEGFLLPTLTTERFFHGLANYRDNVNSTLLDVRAGKPSELSYILGRFRSIAKSLGVSTPEADAVAKELSDTYSDCL